MCVHSPAAQSVQFQIAIKTHSPTSSNEKVRTAEHFEAIDGLRGFASLAVVLYHCYVHCGRYQWPVIQLGKHSAALSRLLVHGHGGVALFFIVSGFCLAYPRFTRSNPEDWSRWFARRAYRILPPYYASVAIFWILAVLLRNHSFTILGMTTPTGAATPARQVAAALTLVNVFFNPSYWTLVLEVRWYLLFPLLMAGWRRIGAAAMLLTVWGISAIAIWATTRSARFAYLSAYALSFLPIFALGILIASWTAKKTTPAALKRYSLPGLVASVLLIAWLEPSEGPGSLLWMLILWAPCAFFTLLAVLHSPTASKVARTKSLTSVGIFSYSLYLIHEPVVHLAHHLVQQRDLSPAAEFFVYQALLVPVCVGLGYLFHLAVEGPLLSHARRVFATP